MAINGDMLLLRKLKNMVDTEKKILNDSNFIQCPCCGRFIDITNHNFKENTVISCANCNTYINYKTDSSITVIKKEVNRGRHDKD